MEVPEPLPPPRSPRTLSEVAAPPQATTARERSSFATVQHLCTSPLASPSTQAHCTTLRVVSSGIHRSSHRAPTARQHSPSRPPRTDRAAAPLHVIAHRSRSHLNPSGLRTPCAPHIRYRSPRRGSFPARFDRYRTGQIYACQSVFRLDRQCTSYTARVSPLTQRGRGERHHPSVPPPESLASGRPTGSPLHRPVAISSRSPTDTGNPSEDSAARDRIPTANDHGDPSEYRNHQDR